MGSAENKTWLTAVCAEEEEEEEEGKRDEKSSGEGYLPRRGPQVLTQVDTEMLDSLRATPIRTYKRDECL